MPTVAPDGSVFVAFTNEQNQSAWEPGEQFDDQWLVVKSSDGGASWSRPVHVVDMEDGTRDYPINANRRQTLTGYQLRVNSRGNIVADPRSGMLYLVFSDNRAGAHDSDTPVTNTNVYLMASPDGTNWSGPFTVSDRNGDQWFPWVDVNPVTGMVGVLYNDRRDTAPRYGASLAQGMPGDFTVTSVSTAKSHPRTSFFFQARIPGCFRCALFNGDYVALTYGSNGAANLAWTDMRDPFGAGQYLQFVYFARR